MRKRGGESMIKLDLRLDVTLLLQSSGCVIACWRPAAHLVCRWLIGSRHCWDWTPAGSTGAVNSPPSFEAECPTDFTGHLMIWLERERWKLTHSLTHTHSVAEGIFILYIMSLKSKSPVKSFNICQCFRNINLENLWRIIKLLHPDLCSCSQSSSARGSASPHIAVFSCDDPLTFTHITSSECEESSG